MRGMTTLFLLLAVLQDKPFPAGDPADAILAARKRAAAENRRVLVLSGSNDSEPSRALAALLKKDRDLSRTILYEYDLVLADAAEKKTLPWLTILDADGKPLADVEAPREAAALVALLKKHQAEPLKAKDVLDAAMKRAADEKKRLLLTFGAPW